MENELHGNNDMVSVIIPCRNEEKFIAKCLDSIVAQDYPRENIEVLVVDAMSSDRTREIVNDYVEKYSFIKMIDNPGKYSVFAFNIGIKESHGEYITLLGAHSVYSSDRLTKSVHYIRNHNVDAVGAQSNAISRDNSVIGRAIVYAISLPFGSGNSHRLPVKKPKFVDTAAGCLYKKEVFEKIGLFNEKLIYSQDIEFNKRLVNNGGKILIVPDIITNYFARSDFGSFCRHNFRNGLWSILPFKYSKIVPVSLRHLVPVSFILGLCVMFILSLFSSFFQCLFLSVLLCYVGINLYYSFKVSIKNKNLIYFLLMPIMFISLHFVYGIGSTWGLVKCIFDDGA